MPKGKLQRSVSDGKRSNGSVKNSDVTKRRNVKENYNVNGTEN